MKCAFLAILPVFATGQNAFEYPYDEQRWKGTCLVGESQSPIELHRCASAGAAAVNVGQPEYFYDPTTTISFENTGHGISIRPAVVQQYVKYNLKNYVLNDCHFHVPSEHTINNKRYDMEMHCVHTNVLTANVNVVVGLLFQISGSTGNTLIGSLVQHLPTTQNTPSSYTGPINVEDFYTSLDRQRMWKYTGSYTTPPCTEGITWFVLQDVQNITQAQHDSFQTAIGIASVNGNFRPPQAPHGRTVLGCSAHDVSKLLFSSIAIVVYLITTGS